jgi:hypothetical protein
MSERFGWIALQAAFDRVSRCIECEARRIRYTRNVANGNPATSASNTTRTRLATGPRRGR